MRFRLLLCSLVLLALAPSLAAQSILRSFDPGLPDAEGVAYDHDAGWVVAVDVRSGLLCRYGRNGVLDGAFLLDGLWPGVPLQPVACAADPISHDLWIADARGWIVRRDSTGKGAWGGWPTAPAVGIIGDIALDPAKGTIWVSDLMPPLIGQAQIVEFDLQGNLLQVMPLFGLPSVQPVEGLAWHAATGNFFVSYTSVWGERLAQFSGGGTYLAQWDLGAIGVHGRSLACDELAGRLFVLDGPGGRVRELEGVLPPLTTTVDLEGLVSGGTATIRVSGATPGGPVRLAYSLAGPGRTTVAAGSCGTLVALLKPGSWTALPVLIADVHGDAAMSVPIPPGTSLLPIRLQALDVASCTLSGLCFNRL